MVSMRALLIHLDADGKLGGRVEHILVGHHLEAQAVERIRGVGEQFPQEHLPVVPRMDQDIEQLPGFRLEVKGLGIIWLSLDLCPSWFLLSKQRLELLIVMGLRCTHFISQQSTRSKS